jgi:hypothetical protein
VVFLHAAAGGFVHSLGLGRATTNNSTDEQEDGAGTIAEVAGRAGAGRAQSLVPPAGATARACVANPATASIVIAFSLSCDDLRRPSIGVWCHPHSLVSQELPWVGMHHHACCWGTDREGARGSRLLMRSSNNLLPSSPSLSLGRLCCRMARMQSLPADQSGSSFPCTPFPPGDTVKNTRTHLS